MKLKQEDIGVALMYIPAHKGIRINEEADELAKTACSTGDTYNNGKVFWKEFIHDIKKELFN